MSAATMLVLIASVVAVLAFTASALIWLAHPIETAAASCGTLRAPANPVVLVRPVGVATSGGDIEAAVAAGHCDRARDQVRGSHQLAIAAGGIATATALGAVVVGTRERRQLEADAVAHAERMAANGSPLGGHGLPGRPAPQVSGPGADVWERLGPGGSGGRR